MPAVLATFISAAPSSATLAMALYDGVCRMEKSMPEDDQTKWNQRYREGAYAERGPSAWLETLLQSDMAMFALSASRIAGSPTACDLACGRGRNSLLLASHGYTVDAWDISDIGLAAAAAQTENACINWIQRDLLEQGLPEVSYDLVVVFRFVAPELMQRLHQHVRPGGYVVTEQHLQLPPHSTAWHELCGAAGIAPDSVTPNEINGPRSARFRVPPGVQASWLEPMQIRDQFEGLVREPDGEFALLSRVCAQRT